ncbi:S8 family peptidase [Falsibacillus albus]|uniref:Peptidase S8/S53 domain-containing protein n=1 Tax=Falsibacillus albus TaxID=2478915 RepID=A0A3L7JUE2_9BACI|nr:S8 family peptidase [Falsibacillus albus]RLQ94488.1 hypothetical protein D9X91_13160 [Falsibacillus albus]
MMINIVMLLFTAYLFYRWRKQRSERHLVNRDNSKGKGIRIAIIDSGIFPHKDLTISGGVNLVDPSEGCGDDFGHGTHIAGIIASKLNGLAPGAEIYAVKVLDKVGNGRIADVVKGIEWAIEHEMDIINMSLLTQTDCPQLEDAVKRAYDHGILLVAAAGNTGKSENSNVMFPARYAEVIAVSAVNSRLQRAPFSSHGNGIEFAAIGVKVKSTYLKNKYKSFSGTSVAAPVVSARLAILKEENPGLSHIELRDLLQKSAVDIGPEGVDSFSGYGLVQK